jgi:hypothetical protein
MANAALKYEGSRAISGSLGSMLTLVALHQSCKLLVALRWYDFLPNRLVKIGETPARLQRSLRFVSKP